MHAPAVPIGTSVLHPVRPIFRAIVETTVPEARDLSDPEWSELEAIVERALRDRPAAMRRKLNLFLRIVNGLPVARFGRRFVALDHARRTTVLEALQRAPLLAIRRGVWGVRTLAFMGYYARPGAAERIGYRASPLGWEMRR